MAIRRLRAFVAIGHQLSEDYVSSLGTHATEGVGSPRALASHVVRVEVLLGSVTATRRAFECGGVDVEAELEELVVRALALATCHSDMLLFSFSWSSACAETVQCSLESHSSWSGSRRCLLAWKQREEALFCWNRRLQSVLESGLQLDVNESVALSCN
jgi:hypothetical protein